jgi:hypothetical protein
MMIKFAFVVVSVKDYPRRGIAFHADWFDALAGTIKDYWRDMSGGRIQLYLSRYPDLELQMSKEDKDKLSAPDLINAIRAAGNDRGDPFGDDEHLIAIMDDNSSSGVTVTDPVLATVDIDAAILCHEMGHFFQHLNKVDSSHADSLPRFLLLEYGDPTCIMGAEGGKYSYPEPTLVLAGSAGHEDAGPAMCPPMTVRTGWLDEGNPNAVVDVTPTLPVDVQLDRWTGAPPSGHAGRPSVAIVDDHAPDCDRIYLSLRSPQSRWDGGFPPAPGGAPGTATVVAQELLGNGATLLLNTCPSVTGSWMRLGRAPLRIDIRDGSHDSVVIRVTADPWRNWTPLTTPNGQPVHRVAAVARLDAIDLFVIADDGLVYTLPFRNGMWQSWQLLTGAGFPLNAGIAVASTTPDTMDLFVVGTDRQIRHHHFGPAGWDEAWPVIAGGDLDERSGLAAAPNGRGRVELFASTVGGRVVHTTVTGGVAGDWEDLPALPTAHAVAANTLADGVIQVHAVTEGANDLRLFSITSTRGVWETGWFNHGQVPLADRAAVASVTPASGSAFLIGSDNPMFVRSFKTGAWLGTATYVDGLTLGPDSSIAAVSRDPRSIDVAAVGADGSLHVISASSDPNFVPANRQTLRTYEAMLIHGGAFVSALPFGFQSPTLWNTEQVPGPAEKFMIHELQDASETVGGKQVTKTLVAVQAVNGKFVTAESGGGSMLIARADKVGNWEMFKLFTHPQNGDFRVFQALGGHAWRADGDGGGLVDCRGVTPLGWEEFAVV